MERRLIAHSPLVLALLAAACSSSGNVTSQSAAITSVAVDRFKELTVVEPSVVDDARSSNAADGPWSFRYAIENMAPAGTDPGEFVRQWILGWQSATTFNGYPLDRAGEGRSASIQKLLLCPWEQQTPANNCDATCSACIPTPKLDLSKAPFQLIAIVNRIDLRQQPGITESGEARLVYALKSGPADDPASVTMPMTAILEYQLPPSKTPVQWAQSFHALGQFTTFGEPYNAALQAITDGFVSRGVWPTNVNGSALHQLRTNESAFEWIWQMREFTIQADGNLHMNGLRNTPAEANNNTPTLASYVMANADAIKANKYMVPVSLLGGSADELMFSWQVSGADPATSTAFIGGTCNGCHITENPNIDVVFHISPFRVGTARLSPFLNNPASPATDELARRTQVFSDTLAGH